MLNKLVVALSALFLIASAPALADDDRRGRGNNWEQDDDDRRWQQLPAKHVKHEKKAKKYKYKKYRKAERHGPDYYARGRGHYDYQGRGRGHDYDRDRRRVRRDDWAIYAILALQIVEMLNENQRDSFAYAQQRAVSVPLGETIRWNDGPARGSVVSTRDGSDSNGRYCREFQQEVVVGNRRQSGYGVACRQPNGDWEIVS